MAKDTVYLVCKHCGHREKLSKTTLLKIAGGAIVAMGWKAWLVYLFAGTGVALPLCLSISAIGVLMASKAKLFATKINKLYPCKRCKQRDWDIKTEEEINLESNLKRQSQVQREEKEQYQEHIRRYQDTISRYEDDIERYRDDLEQYHALIMEERIKNDYLIQKLEEGNHNDILQVEALKKLFMESFYTCQKEMDIYVPKIGRRFLSNEFQEALSNALDRGVIVKVRSGYFNLSDARAVQNFKDDFYGGLSEQNKGFYHADQLKLKVDDSHAKLFIVDTDYYVIGSMNFLSNDGEQYYDKKSRTTRDVWNELGEKSSNQNNLIIYRQQFFNF